MCRIAAEFEELLFLGLAEGTLALGVDVHPEDQSLEALRIQTYTRVSLWLREKGVQLAVHGRALPWDGAVSFEGQLPQVFAAESEQALVGLGRREVEPCGGRAVPRGPWQLTHDLSSTGCTS